MGISSLQINSLWGYYPSTCEHSHTKEQTAANYDLPLEAVEEAMAYYQGNRALIEAEIEEEGRRLRAVGLSPDK